VFLENEKVSSSFTDLLITFCEQARKYDWVAEGEARQSDRDAKQKSADIAKRMHVLAFDLEQFAWQMSVPLCGASVKSGVHLVVKDDGDDWKDGALCSPGYPIRLALLLKALGDEVLRGRLV
jgi:hypothetical protein